MGGGVVAMRIVRDRIRYFLYLVMAGERVERAVSAAEVAALVTASSL
jgi:hypothetical protein